MRESKHSIAVVIPTLGRKSLSNALESIFSQTLKPTSVFVVDDSLGQEVILEPGEVVTILINTGGGKGQSFARNLGMKRSKSNFIAFLDDDDIWLKHHLEYAINQMHIQSLDAIYTSAFVNGSRSPKVPISGRTDPLIEIYSQRLRLKSSYYLPTPGLVIREEVARHIEFHEKLKDGEDLWFAHKIFEFGFKIRQMEEITVRINFDRKRQRDRSDLKSYLDWSNRLLTVQKRASINFLLNVALRNQVMKGDLKGALQLIKNIVTVLRSKVRPSRI